VQRQSLQPAELVIVVDGHVPQSLKRVLQLAVDYKEITAVVEFLPERRGLWNARNVGLTVCQHDTVALHDADDIMHPQRLEIQSELFQSHKVSVLGSPVLEFATVTQQIVGIRETKSEDNLSHSDFWLKNPIHHSSVMLSRSSVVEVGRYRNLPGVEDLDLWRRLARSGAAIRNDSRVVQLLGTSDALLQRRRMTRHLLRNEFQIARDFSKSPEQSAFIRAGIGFLLRCSYRMLPNVLMRPTQAHFLRSGRLVRPNTVDEFLALPPIDLTDTEFT
jgi:glycosyltransferase involved in cell wall biosynthesis